MYQRELTTSAELGARRQMAFDMLDRLCQQIEVTGSQFQKATTAYEAVGTWLSESDCPHLNTVEIYPQGSIALETAIKPMGRNEFDVDLVCHLPNVKNSASAKDIKALIGDRLKEHGTYEHMLEEKKRCWRINYADQFHLDITPSISNPQCLQNGELVPDKALAKWKPTNPRGYLRWFDHNAAIRPSFSLVRRTADIAACESLQPLPEPTLSKPFLKRIVQLLKRHRDHYFLKTSHPELAPISIIITTLAARAYTKCALEKAYEDEYDFITTVIRTMPSFILTEDHASHKFYFVENETTKGENFADKWNSDPRLATTFYNWHSHVLTSVDSLLTAKGLDVAAESLSKNFGAKDGGREILLPFTEAVGNARLSGLLTVSPSLGLTTSSVHSDRAIPIPKNTFFGNKRTSR